MSTVSEALLQSLLHGPLLLGDLPEATVFPRDLLTLPERVPMLRLDQKLGHLCEDALAVLLESSPRVKLLARHVRLQRGAQKTVGELDFVVRDLQTGRLIHLELATKFYLAVETQAGILLPGPDARDHYHRKLERLRTHQLTLAGKSNDCLPEAFRGEPITVQQLVYGCLFDPIAAAQPVVPEFSQPDCRRGFWIGSDDCEDHFPQGTRFQIIPKPLWPVPFEWLPDMPLESWEPSQTVDRCLMVRVNQECWPCFVTPRGWPNAEQR